MLEKQELEEMAEPGDDHAGWSVARWGKLTDARKAGRTLGEAADELDCSVATVSRRWRMFRDMCIRANIKDPGEWDQRRPPEPSADELREMAGGGEGTNP